MTTITCYIPEEERKDYQAKIRILSGDQETSIRFDSTDTMDTALFGDFVEKLSSGYPGSCYLWFYGVSNSICLRLKRERLTFMFHHREGSVPSGIKITLPVGQCVLAIKKLYRIHCEIHENAIIDSDDAPIAYDSDGPRRSRNIKQAGTQLD